MKAFLQRIRRMFGRKSTTLSSRTASLVTYTATVIKELSNWAEKSDFEVYEQIYRVEPEIGGAIDRMSSLVARAYQGLYVKAGKQLEPDEEKLMKAARAVEQALNVRRWFEIITEMLMIYGNAYIHIKPNHGKLPTLTILPNDRVTIVDKRSRIGRTDSSDVIVDANFYVLNEGSVHEDQKVYRKDEIIHIKYKDTPVYVRDRLGRLTYGIYSMSPLERAILPVLWKREVMLIDVIWRWKNVPREHHKISSELFDLSKYTGSLEERRQKAKQDAETTISEYINQISEKHPDQAYVTTDTVDISVINPSSRYMSPNELMEQLSGYIWIAMGVPESIVSGRSRGSYASELVVSSYVTARALRIAEKIRDALLPVIRDTIRSINPNLPVEKLDMKLELVLENNRIDLFRQAAIMKELGCFTPTEVRRHLGYEELTESQLNELLLWTELSSRQSMGRPLGLKTLRDVWADVQKTLDDFAYPDTPHVQEKHRGGG